MMGGKGTTPRRLIPLVEIKNGKVEYVSGLIFRGVNWRIGGNISRIRGPNGCGKALWG